MESASGQYTVVPFRICVLFRAGKREAHGGRIYLQALGLNTPEDRWEKLVRAEHNMQRPLRALFHAVVIM